MGLLFKPKLRRMLKTTLMGEGESKIILLVDESAAGCAARQTLLEEEGYQVLTACNASAALEFLQAAKVDVILTDYRVSGHSGAEWIAELRARAPQARVAVLSGLVTILGLTEQNTGADAVIAKGGHEVPQMLRVVRRLLEPVPRKGARSHGLQRAQARSGE